MKAFRTVLFLIATCTTVSDAAAYDCATVRAYVAQHGVKVAYRWARAQGYSSFEIALVRATCFLGRK